MLARKSIWAGPNIDADNHNYYFDPRATRLSRPAWELERQSIHQLWRLPGGGRHLFWWESFELC